MDIVRMLTAVKNQEEKKKLPAVPSPVPEAALPSASCDSPSGLLFPKLS